MKDIGEVRIKICGITNQKDAELAVSLGASALGFNMYPGSKRYIDLAAEAEWIGALPPLISRVAVLVNPSLQEAIRISSLPYIDLLQFHGSESREFCAAVAAMGIPFIKALALRDESAASQPAGFSTRYLLLDAYSNQGFGGLGKLIDLNLAEQFRNANGGSYLLLSGGLNPHNVADAICRVRPYAVDVASGVEREPRRKDPALMEAFIKAVRGAA